MKNSSFWSEYGNAINLLGGGFIGGFSGFYLRGWKKIKIEKIVIKNSNILTIV